MGKVKKDGAKRCEGGLEGKRRRSMRRGPIPIAEPITQ
jgi:hypothetical protein